MTALAVRALGSARLSPYDHLDTRSAALQRAENNKTEIRMVGGAAHCVLPGPGPGGCDQVLLGRWGAEGRPRMEMRGSHKETLL